MAKTKNRIQLTGGVIVIGSLFWENETNCVTGQEAKGKLRQKWRDTSLNLKETKAIALPVRYGRFSSKKNRKETYTMDNLLFYCKLIFAPSPDNHYLYWIYALLEGRLINSDSIPKFNRKGAAYAKTFSTEIPHASTP